MFSFLLVMLEGTYLTNQEQADKSHTFGPAVPSLLYIVPHTQEFHKSQERRASWKVFASSETTFCVPHAELRDFTINALFYDPRTNEVLDFVGGIPDLEVRPVSQPTLLIKLSILDLSARPIMFLSLLRVSMTFAMNE